MQQNIIQKRDRYGRMVPFFYCLLFIVTFSLCFRFFTSATVEQGGDAFYKWGFIRQYVLFGDFPATLNHHVCRWAINIPVYFIQKYIGTGPGVYYVWPFLTATLSAVFSFLLLEKIRGWRTGLAGAVLVILSEPMLRLGTQFLPMGAVVAYLLGALYFLVRWQHNRNNAVLVISSLFLFFCYGAKITSIYYLPAFLVLIYLAAENKRASIRSILCFLGVFIMLLALETYVFDSMTGATLGRVELIQRSHHAIHTGNPNATWQSSSDSLLKYVANFFVYFTYPGKAPSFLYYLAFGLSLLAFVKRLRPVYPLAVPFLCGFLGTAYAITSVFPFARPERMLFRYQAAIFELALLVVVLFLSSNPVERLVGNRKLPFNAGGREIRVLLFLLLAVPVATYSFKHVKMLNNGYMKTLKTMQLVSQASETHQPVFIPYKAGIRRSIKRIFLYRLLFSDERYHADSLYSFNAALLEGRPLITRDGKTYMLVDSNGCSENFAEHAVILIDFD
ncbi:hypothetical protein [Desulfovibrio sp. Huiquan2017]|uniref:ArnT family glycosyltransferase n=1 Tax=Desulfovibrio sp. Huiquan2017 TaxID=2816861 RepID=UPI001A9289C9|nr:hypothetical protein [Desulfovibrio sp. Huiquan2017]